MNGKGNDRSGKGNTADPPNGFSVPVSPALYRRLENLSMRHERTVDELLEAAVEMHYGEESVNARFRVVDRLARLEADLGGDPASVTGDLMDALRSYRGIDP